MTSNSFKNSPIIFDILNVDQMWELSSRKTDNFRKTNSKKKNIFYKLKPGVKGVSLLKKLKPNYSRNFKQVDIMRNKQVDEANIKVDKFSENKNELLMLELYRFWQESALKTLELNEKCIAAINELKEQSLNANRNQSSGGDSGAGSTRSSSPVSDLCKSNEEIPPPPPPRNEIPYAPPVPPLPAHLLKPQPSVLPNRNKFPSPPTQPRINGHTPLIQTNSYPSHHLLIQQMQSLDLQNYSLPSNRALSMTYSDYRNSPSSGFYSYTSNSSTSSVMNMPTDQLDKPMVILQSVKSTQVERPKLQKAVALPAQLPPPPPYSSTQLCNNSLNFCSVPTTDPPTYSSSIHSITTSSCIPQTTTAVKPSTSSYIASRRPPLPLPSTSSSKISVFNTNNVNNNSAQKIQHHSPILERRNSRREDERRDFKVPPQAFKFFMEQHIENVIKSHKQRMYRRLQLESEMTKIGLSEEAQCQMRKMLCQKESNYIRLKRTKIDKSMFTKIKLIGVGAFGEVTLVRKIDTHQLYAMKTLRKIDVLKRNQVAHVKAERDILVEADNEWVVKLYFSFQDIDHLYFVMEYIPGGDLMSLLIKFGIFEEQLARFYLAELTCAVESVHKIGFIHRDIKPDNILIDRDGHIKLTDFGLCTGFRWTHNSKYYENGHNRQDSMEFNKKWTNGVDCNCSKLKPLERRRRQEEHQRCLAHSLVGTPNYIAPEVLLRTGYTQLCDWWSVGVVLYEMLVGCPPFSADSPLETQYKIINWQNTLRIPPNADVSPEAADLILKLCTSSDKRLGKNVNEVKQHPFLANIDFSKGIRKLTSPYIPKIHHSTDTSNFDPVQSEGSRENSFSIDSNSSTESSNSNQPFHGFFEFTFRRFFDDGGGVPFSAKIKEEPEEHNAVYV